MIFSLSQNIIAREKVKKDSQSLGWKLAKSGGLKMNGLDKAREKLEKVGFAGQTLNRAMELLERTNVSMVSKILVKMVTKRGLTPSMALYEAEKGLREAEEKLGFSSED